ncbi:MAG: Omp28-related outer membrane protein [Melioribacteraceae bacterium]|nr:Omp28-related outer membrane protein [Melioribacteraceae bacterium]MCF8353234.1 Omp28-related outer membrane protein [Melioribacteraceae bacterium]MCF8393966.1 Omp28-related outer membrane protein [Melioribacteraceae bacterium]MCF8418732.1 Omp28-related outer membrane protein [Melioribacteraceae bacterium]
MRRLAILLLIVFIISSSLNAQARKIVLLEEATNASCPPCAANNPGLQEFFSKHFGGVISVRYHASWPGVDPMYSLNIPENTARIDYYNISGVPNYTMDGVNYGIPSNTLFMKNHMNELIAETSPVKIEVDAEFNPDSVIVSVKLIAYNAVTQSNLKLRTSIIERIVSYASPPGTNGETEFPDTMRDLIPDSNGEPISEINAGDTLTYSYSVAVNPQWNWEDLAVVSWLQSDDTKEVIQSNINIPTFIIFSSQPSVEFIDTNSTVVRNYSIFNDNNDSLNIELQVSEKSLPGDWSYDIMIDGFPQDSVYFSIAPGDSVSFDLQILTGSDAGNINLDLFAKNLDDPHQFGFTRSYKGILKNGNILVVDNDGGDNYETNYFNILEELELKYTAIAEADLLLLSDEVLDFNFDAVFWNAGWGFPALVPADVEFLDQYLNNVGNLFIAGQDIGWDIFDSDGSSNFQAAKDFYNITLDAKYLGDNSNTFIMTGVESDPVGNGLAFSIGTAYARYPEWIESNTGGSVEFIKYQGTTKFGGVRYQNRKYKSVYLGIGLEQITNSEMRKMLIENTLNWFGMLTDVNNESDKFTVNSYKLFQNYPNPFNPTTEIKYQLVEDSHIKLKVFDILGKEVAVPVDGFVKSGVHTFEFDASNISSGVYFYKIETNNFTDVKKMMILR